MPAAAANRCGRRRPWWDRPLGVTGGVGVAGECAQGGEETPGARRVGGDSGGRPVCAGGCSGCCGRGAAGRTRRRCWAAPSDDRRNDVRTSQERHRHASHAGVDRVDAHGARTPGVLRWRPHDRARTDDSPAGAASSPGRRGASGRRSPGRSPARARRSALLDVAADVKAVAAELDGPAEVADLADPPATRTAVRRAGRRARRRRRARQQRRHPAHHAAARHHGRGVGPRDGRQRPLDARHDAGRRDGDDRRRPRRAHRQHGEHGRQARRRPTRPTTRRRRPRSSR